MQNIHWLGAGLSSIPGIRRLAKKDVNLTVWNRTLSKAEKSIDHVNSQKVNAKKYNLEELENVLNSGDIVVSQLSAYLHIDIAKLCIKKKCHFVSTSYISEELKRLDDEAKKLNLIFLNEVGLDPGIDHFFSHLLVKNLKNKNLDNISVKYESYCGGVPAVPNDFKYKFSWSPIGVIKALNNKSKFIEDYKEKIVIPFKNIKNYIIKDESFEAYPNRDSTPYINEYNFLNDWKIEEFVRGTLRLNGWSEAWKDIFNILENKSDDLEKKIEDESKKLWDMHKYNADEEDRVILYVSLEAKNNDKTLWKEAYHLDEKGSGEETAMAKLVSITLSAGIDLILQNKIKPGLQAASSDTESINYYFKVLSEHSIKINHQ